MRDSADRSKSLEELTAIKATEPSFYSHLVVTCHQLWRKPLNEFSIEDLRIMIGQQMGLEFLVPQALEILGREPLAEGELYRGDLLSAVTKMSLSKAAQPAHYAAAALP